MHSKLYSAMAWRHLGLQRAAHTCIYICALAYMLTMMCCLPQMQRFVNLFNKQLPQLMCPEDQDEVLIHKSALMLLNQQEACSKVSKPMCYPFLSALNAILDNISFLSHRKWEAVLAHSTDICAVSCTFSPAFQSFPDLLHCPPSLKVLTLKHEPLNSLLPVLTSRRCLKLYRHCQAYGCNQRLASFLCCVRSPASL